MGDDEKQGTKSADLDKEHALRDTYPDPTFIGWFRWSALRDGTLDETARRAVQEVGTYLLAGFKAGPPAVVDRTDKHIFYIGETHGPSRSLKVRLMDFGRSAAFLGKPRPGHYAAWAFGTNDTTAELNVDDVYVAVCAYSGSATSPPDARGLFPIMVESMMLWSYLNVHGCMPALNNSGKQGPPELAPTWDETALRSLLDATEPYEFADKLLAQVAESRGYAPRTTRRWTEDGWSGISRAFGGGNWGSFGWRNEPREIGVWLTNGKAYRFDSEGREATSDTALRTLLDEFWREI